MPKWPRSTAPEHAHYSVHGGWQLRLALSAQQELHVLGTGTYMELVIRCALSLVTAVCACTAVCPQLSLCVVNTSVAQQYSCVFACEGYAYVFEPAILPHLPPAFLRYNSLPSPVYGSSLMYLCVSSYGCAPCNRCSCPSARYILHLPTT